MKQPLPAPGRAPRLGLARSGPCPGLLPFAAAGHVGRRPTATGVAPATRTPLPAAGVAACWRLPRRTRAATAAASSDHPGVHPGGGPGGHPVELPIAFEGGAGTTRAVSPEEVRFVAAGAAAAVALGVGQRIAGTIRFPPAAGRGTAVLLRYAARVTGVAPAPPGATGGGGALEVTARFERLAFVARLAVPVSG